MVAVLSWVAMPVFGGSFAVKDFDKAKEIAKSSNRYIFLNFSGTDWCSHCVRLEKDILKKSDFKNYAKDNLVCVMLDFPIKKLSAGRLPEKHKALIKQFKVRGYPTTFLISPAGDVMERLSSKGPVSAYVERLKAAVDSHRTKNAIALPVNSKSLVFKNAQLKQQQKSHVSTEFLKPLAKDDSREFRTWTSRKGSTIEAKAVEELRGRVVLEKKDKSALNIYIYDLSKADRDYITELKRRL